MGPRIAGVALGLWLMAAPPVLGYGDPARTNHQIVGPIVASVAFIAMGAIPIGTAAIRGSVRHRFGGGWRSLVREASDAARDPR